RQEPGLAIEQVLARVGERRAARHRVTTDEVLDVGLCGGGHDRVLGTAGVDHQRLWLNDEWKSWDGVEDGVDGRGKDNHQRVANAAQRLSLTDGANLQIGPAALRCQRNRGPNQTGPDDRKTLRR